jgi:hypothetical protein
MDGLRMSDSTGVSEVALTIRLETSRPVELVDLGVSFEALGQEYQRFVTRSGYDHLVREGSIVVQLKSLLEQASFLIDHIQVLAGFITNIQDLINFFLGRPAPKQPPVPRDEAERLSSILQPVAKDAGGQLTATLGRSQSTRSPSPSNGRTPSRTACDATLIRPFPPKEDLRTKSYTWIKSGEIPVHDARER